jgi:enhancing lycopene biosynthesis protein 2
MSKKIAVILSGCGNKDGAEIHESAKYSPASCPQFYY